MAKKSWAEKLATGDEVRVELLDKDMSWAKAGTQMVIVTPRVVRDRVARLGAGESLTLPEMRAEFASEFGGDVTCPLTCGIFMRIVSEVAWDEHLAGAPLESVTPFWRAVDPKSPLAKKLRCGQEFLVEMRTKEGIS